jgi:transcriptional regulator of acetoin/glycerol metabolism
LIRVLAAFDGKKALAAEALGISRKNLWEKLKLHGIGAGDETATPALAS